jgi:hypothetical protein
MICDRGVSARCDARMYGADRVPRVCAVFGRIATRRGSSASAMVCPLLRSFAGVSVSELVDAVLSRR